MANGRIVELVAFAVHHIDRSHDHARRAVAALQAVVLAECLLHWVQWSVRFGEPLDGEDIGAFQLPGEDGARLHGLAVHVHDTGAACEVSQPTWVPVRRRCSRRNCTRSVRGSTSAVTALPFTVIATAVMTSSSKPASGLGFCADRRCRHRMRSKSDRFCPAEWRTSRTLNRCRAGGQGHLLCDAADRRAQLDCCTAAANLAKKSSAVFLAALLISRCPSWASLPPICASTS